MKFQLRRYEWILAAFFVYIASVATLMGRPVGIAGAFTIANGSNSLTSRC